MALHFSREEYAERMSRLRAAMAERDLDGMLLFAQESMYWLTGYDTFGYCFFQCMVVDRDGGVTLLTRSADRRQAEITSIVEDVRIWVDRASATPGDDLADLLKARGLAGKSLGIETRSHGLTAANGAMVREALDGVATLVEASLLAPRLRLVKSAAEIAHVERASALADEALDAAIEKAAPGADEGAILAAMHHAIFEGGGDYPANPFIIGSGPDALLCRYKSGRRRLDRVDQLTLEFAGVWRHYHCAAMRTFAIGRPTPRHRDMHLAAEEALLAAEAAMRPGATMGDVYGAQAAVLDRAGMSDCRLAATGYALGAVFAPSWMDWPMFFEGAPQAIDRDMVFFVHIILFDDRAGAAMSLGRTSRVAENGGQPFSTRSLDLIVRS